MRRRLLPPALVAFAFVILGRAGVARACTCTDPPIKEALKQAETAFIGAVSDLGLDYSKHERVTGFTVQRVFKGTVPEHIRVVSALDEAACGYAFTRGTVYVVFTRTVAGRPHTSLCSGNRALAPGKQAPPELGTGSAPAKAAQ